MKRKRQAVPALSKRLLRHLGLVLLPCILLWYALIKLVMHFYRIGPID